MEYSIISQNAWKNAINDADQGTFFNDGQRKIDMVLAYEDSDAEEVETEAPQRSAASSRRGGSSRQPGQHELAYRRKARTIFERNLEIAGLQLEKVNKSVSFEFIYRPLEERKFSGFNFGFISA